MGESRMIDYASFMSESIPEDLKEQESHFSIEISIVMRKPKGHFSRAPGVVLDILSSFGGGTFFEGQGYWKGVQEPVVYILISTTGTTAKVIQLVKEKLASAQSKLKQKEMFVKINGTTFVGNFLSESITKNFPEQWEFDSDMKIITANQSRSDEHHNLIYGRVDYQNGNYTEAQQKWTDMINEFGDLVKQNKELKQTELRDLMKCYSNILSPKLSLEEKFVESICNQFNELLPPNVDCEFDTGVLSKHAEGRMRGNRLKLYKLIGSNTINMTDLIEDGFFAVEQIVSHLENGASPYLEQDPIQDICTIFKHILKINQNQESRIKDDLVNLAAKFPAYETEFRKMIK